MSIVYSHTAQYPLFAFSNGKDVIVTRGYNESEALHHASTAFGRGEGVYALTYVMIAWYGAYNKNHRFDWLNTMPFYKSGKVYSKEYTKSFDR